MELRTEEAPGDRTGAPAPWVSDDRWSALATGVPDEDAPDELDEPLPAVAELGRTEVPPEVASAGREAVEPAPALVVSAVDGGG
jgi:hypothetical protein